MCRGINRSMGSWALISGNVQNSKEAKELFDIHRHRSTSKITHESIYPIFSSLNHNLCFLDTPIPTWCFWRIMLLHDWVRRTVTVEHFEKLSHPISFPAKLYALADILDMKQMWNDTQRWFAVCWRNRVLVGTASELQWSQKGLHLKLLSNRLSHLSSSKNAIWFLGVEIEESS